MGKTTNILDLNNRLTKVEKENVAQNSYTSLKNKPKINSVTLTGNKSLADIGAAAAADLTNIGNRTDLGNVQGSGTITLSNAVTNYRFVQILIGYYNTGYPCFGHALLPVSALLISAEDIPITVAFTDRTGTNTGCIDISFLSATSAKVVNTSATLHTIVIGIT